MTDWDKLRQTVTMETYERGGADRVLRAFAKELSVATERAFAAGRLSTDTYPIMSASGVAKKAWEAYLQGEFHE